MFSSWIKIKISLLNRIELWILNRIQTKIMEISMLRPLSAHISFTHPSLEENITLHYYLRAQTPSRTLSLKTLTTKQYSPSSPCKIHQVPPLSRTWIRHFAMEQFHKMEGTVHYVRTHYDTFYRKKIKLQRSDTAKNGRIITNKIVQELLRLAFKACF